MQKLQERTSVFEKAELTPKAVSSEESTPECDDVFVKPIPWRIPWRSQLVNHFFEELDTKNLEKKTAQAMIRVFPKCHLRGQ